MALTYIGNCAWEQTREPEYSGQGMEPETITDTWTGQTSGLAAFLDSYPLRSSYLGGYITRRSVKDLSPGPGLATVELTITLPPPYGLTVSPATFSTRSVSISGYLENNTIDPQYFHYMIKRETVYSAPTTRYRYFASARPSGPANSSAGGTIIKLKDSITVDCYGQNPSDPTDTSKWTKLETYVRNPSQINALLKAEVPLNTIVKSIVEPEPIEGTPYWRCTDTCTADYKNDDDA